MSRIAVVTGGNKGIGREIARELAAQGMTVVLTARNEAKALEAAAGMQGSITVRKLDVTSADDADALAQFIDEKFGRADVLVNNAGIISTKGAVEADLDEARRILDTNLLGAWRVTLALLPLLKNSDDARIINISSEMGTQRELVGGYAAYRISKHALNALTRIMAYELKGTSIKVNAMHPGWVRTDMGGDAGPRSVEHGADTAVWLATAPSVPTGKFFFDREEEKW